MNTIYIKSWFGEEIANSVTHAVGAVIMLILLCLSAYSYEARSFYRLLAVLPSAKIYQSISHVPLISVYNAFQINARHRPFYDLCGYRELLPWGPVWLSDYCHSGERPLASSIKSLLQKL